MAHAPQNDGNERNDADEPLHAGELVFERTDGDDAGAAARLKGDEEEDPD